MRGFDVQRHMSDRICASMMSFACNQDANVKHFIWLHCTVVCLRSTTALLPAAVT